MRYLVFFLVIFSFSVSAQKRFVNSVHVGLFGNQVDGDGKGGYNHPGIQFGIGNLYKFKDSNGAIGFEMNYAQKGAREWPRPNQGIYDEFKFNLNYVEVPVYYVFEQWGLPFEVGPTFSYLQSSEYNINGIVSTPGEYREFEIGGMFSMNYKITEKLFFKFRITNSILPIFTLKNVPITFLSYGGMHRGAGICINYYFTAPSFKPKATSSDSN